MNFICKITYKEGKEIKMIYVRTLATACKMNKKLHGEIAIISQYKKYSGA